jgi:hypothetical protein
MMRLNFINPNATSEQMVEKRRRMLMLSMISFVCWQGGRIVSELTGPNKFDQHTKDALSFLSSFAFGLWVASMIGILLFVQRLYQRPRIASIINDELYSRNRLQAGFFAFFCVLFAQVVLDIVCAFHSLTGTVCADISILVGCTSFIGATIFLDRE